VKRESIKLALTTEWESCKKISCSEVRLTDKVNTESILHINWRNTDIPTSTHV